MLALDAVALAWLDRGSPSARDIRTRRGPDAGLVVALPWLVLFGGYSPG